MTKAEFEVCESCGAPSFKFPLVGDACGPCRWRQAGLDFDEWWGGGGRTPGAQDKGKRAAWAAWLASRYLDVQPCENLPFLAEYLANEEAGPWCRDCMSPSVVERGRCQRCLVELGETDFREWWKHTGTHAIRPAHAMLARDAFMYSRGFLRRAVGRP